MTNSSPNDVVVLIAEDQYPFREAVECEIEMMGFKPVGVENGKEGFEKFKEHA